MSKKDIPMLIAEATTAMVQNSINFKQSNHGMHFIVKEFECHVDFWPTTGRWISKCGVNGNDLQSLIEFVGDKKLERQVKKSLDNVVSSKVAAERAIKRVRTLEEALANLVKEAESVLDPRNASLASALNSAVLLLEGK